MNGKLILKKIWDHIARCVAIVAAIFIISFWLGFGFYFGIISASNLDFLIYG